MIRIDLNTFRWVDIFLDEPGFPPTLRFLVVVISASFPSACLDSTHLQFFYELFKSRREKQEARSIFSFSLRPISTVTTSVPSLLLSPLSSPSASGITSRVSANGEIKLDFKFQRWSTRFSHYFTRFYRIIRWSFNTS